MHNDAGNRWMFIKTVLKTTEAVNKLDKINIDELNYIYVYVYIYILYTVYILYNFVYTLDSSWPCVQVPTRVHPGG